VRLGLFVTLLGLILVAMALVLPAPPASLGPVPGPSPRGPSATICLTLSYQGVARPELLPRRLELHQQALGARYRAYGDGDWGWREGLWSYAGADSIDVTAHHQPLLRLPVRAASGVGRGVAYQDGTLLVGLLSPKHATFAAGVVAVPCASRGGGAA
jgi:hypothetical protein